MLSQRCSSASAAAWATVSAAQGEKGGEGGGVAVAAEAASFKIVSCRRNSPPSIRSAESYVLKPSHSAAETETCGTGAGESGASDSDLASCFRRSASVAQGRELGSQFTALDGQGLL